MTPLRSIIGASLRKLVAAIGRFGDYYWDQVVLAMRMDNTTDSLWNKTTLAMHMNGTNGSTAFTDEKSHTVTRYGTVAISTTQSKFDGASAYFNGTTDYLRIDETADYGFTTRDFTLELWVYTSTTSAALLDFRTTPDAPGYFHISNGKAAWWYGTASYEGTIAVNTAAWVHIAWVRYRGVLYQYVNGTLDMSVPCTVDFGAKRNLTIGADYAGSYLYTGYIDDLRITKGAARYIDNFTPNNYPFIEPNNTPLFLEETGKTVTALGNTTIMPLSKYGNGSAYFDGAGDYLTVPDSADFALGSGDFTIEGWLQPNVTGVATIITKRSGTAAFGPFHVELDASNHVLASVSSNGTSWVGTITGTTALPTTSWTHFALVKLGTALSLYVGGVSEGTPVTVPSALTSNATVVSVGANADATTAYTGYIDDLRITKGTARYTTTFTPPDRTIPNYKANQYTLLPQVGDPYLGNVVLGMHMDGADNGTTFTDITGKTITAVGNAVTKTATKKFGTASGYFDGTGDYLSSVDHNDWNLAALDFTIECWVNFSALNTATDLVGKRANSSTITGFVFYKTLGNNLGFVASLDGVAWGIDIAGTTPLSSGQFYHCAVIRSTNDYKLFVDGVMVASVTTSGTIYANSAALSVGGCLDSTRMLNGYIDDLRITKGVARYTADFVPPARFPDTIDYDNYDPYYDQVVLGMHMDGSDNGTTFTDVKGKTVTRYGTQITTKTAIKKFGTASAHNVGATNGNYLSLAASSDWAVPGATNYTIELWIYIIAYSSTGGRVVSAGGGTVGWNGTNGIVWLIQTGANGIGLQYWDGSTVRVINCTVALLTWTHIACVFSAGIPKLYVNGVYAGTANYQISTISTTPSLNVFSIPGESGVSAQAANGYTDDLRITKGVARYTANFTPPVKSNPDQRLNWYDPHQSSTVLALHANGTNGSTTITDEKGKTVTANGNALISTTQKKFGVSSVYFDGTGDYLSTPTHADFAFGSGDFTIEGFVYLSTLNVERAIFDTRANASDTGIYLYTSATNYPMVFGNNATIITGSSALAATTWYHLAVVRTYTTVTLYLNGTSIGTATAGYTITCPGSAVIGRKVNSTANDWIGYMDDIRVTKGVARYLTNFVAPAYAFPDQ